MTVKPKVPGHFYQELYTFYTIDTWQVISLT